MRFNVTIIEGSERNYAHFLFDTAKYMAYGLESLGHSCSITQQNIDTSRINILLNAYRADEGAVKLLTSGSIRYVVSQTELLTPDGGINNLGKAHFRTRYLPLLRGAIRVWDWNNRQVAQLATFGVQADILEYGFHPHMEEIRPKVDRDIDLLWFGSSSPHRQAMLDRLLQRGMKVASTFDSVSFYRNDLIARAKIILALKQAPEHTHMPRGRILYPANNRVFVAGERATEQHWTDQLWSSAPTDELPDLLASLLERTDRNQIADERFEILRQYPMSGYLAPLIENLPLN